MAARPHRTGAPSRVTRPSAPRQRFSLSRVAAIAAALALHAGLGLWVSLPVDGAAEEQGASPIVWEVASPTVPVSLPPPPPVRRAPDLGRQVPSDARLADRSSLESAPTPPTDGHRASTTSTASEWHRDPIYQPSDRSPFDRPVAIEYVATRFDSAWTPDGDLVDQLAHRHRAIAIARAVTGYRKPCTEDEKRRRLPRCLPPPSDPRG